MSRALRGRLDRLEQAERQRQQAGRGRSLDLESPGVRFLVALIQAAPDHHKARLYRLLKDRATRQGGPFTPEETAEILAISAEVAPPTTPPRPEGSLTGDQQP